MLDIIELSEEERKVGEKAWMLNLLELIMFYILLAVLLLFIDQYTKYLAELYLKPIECFWQ